MMARWLIALVAGCATHAAPAPAPAPSPTPVPSDPYEAASSAKIARMRGCDIPLGRPEDAHVIADDVRSALVRCKAGGFVLFTGHGAHAMLRADGSSRVPPPAGCPAFAAGDPEGPAFWKEIWDGLRARTIVQNGFGLHSDCAGFVVEPELLAIRIVDWADLDATLALVDASLRAHDICGTVAVEVAGLECVNRR